jgi:hypothetical protein
VECTSKYFPLTLHLITCKQTIFSVCASLVWLVEFLSLFNLAARSAVRETGGSGRGLLTATVPVFKWGYWVKQFKRQESRYWGQDFSLIRYEFRSESMSFDLPYLTVNPGEDTCVLEHWFPASLTVIPLQPSLQFVCPINWSNKPERSLSKASWEQTAGPSWSRESSWSLI